MCQINNTQTPMDILSKYTCSHLMIKKVWQAMCEQYLVHQPKHFLYFYKLNLYLYSKGYKAV